MSTINYIKYQQLNPPKDYNPNKPPEWVLDKICDEKITGKFNIKIKNKCTTCNTFKSTNGNCLCDS